MTYEGYSCSAGLSNVLRRMRTGYDRVYSIQCRHHEIIKVHVHLDTIVAGTYTKDSKICMVARAAATCKVGSRSTEYCGAEFEELLDKVADL